MLYLLCIFQERLVILNQDIDELSKSLSDTWPPGQRPGATPATRFDLPRQYYFNMSHMFFSDDFTNVRKHTEPELLDIEVNIFKCIVYHFFKVEAFM